MLRRTRQRRRAVAGQGAEIIDSEGRRWLDASSSVFVAILGANPPGVAERIMASMRQLQFSYSGQFGSAEEDELAAALIRRAPAGFGKVWLTTSGSAANESAVKLARQYHLARGKPGKTAVICRWHSYHGSTIGAMSLSGSGPRRRPYQPYLLDMPHVPPPDCYRCPWGQDESGCDLACAEAFEAEILNRGADNVSAVLVEPVAGAPLGALVAPHGYLSRIREICDRHDVLMIVDEVVSGLGRTGSWLVIDQDGVAPDMITLAKGLGGGYTPIGALLLHDRIAGALDRAGTSFNHGDSFTGHRIMAAAGAAVVDFIEKERLVERVRENGPRLHALLAPLEQHPIVGKLRGRGYLYGVELVADKLTRQPFAREAQVSERVAAAAARNGVLFQTGNAAANGRDGDTVMIAPPYVTTDAQLSEIVSVLGRALDDVNAEIRSAA
ncbi:hypothetical protein LL06_13025 [Hoeflea sp. BAL378]|nr:hypothetical protein LL06_13025 [Hoeflea sp. BAL378]